MLPSHPLLCTVPVSFLPRPRYAPLLPVFLCSLLSYGPPLTRPRLIFASRSDTSTASSLPPLLAPDPLVLASRHLVISPPVLASAAAPRPPSSARSTRSLSTPAPTRTTHITTPSPRRPTLLTIQNVLTPYLTLPSVPMLVLSLLLLLLPAEVV
ncbi:hypothetical protein C8R46DRAFT_1215100 [Mycena filopes]|nr:hypothetical protein C8R46DRAFT_1215100 [Mycena filopes]